jgi:predicted PurR-regulated permease PerM
MHEQPATSSQETPPIERTSLRFVAHATLVVVSIVATALFLWQIVDALLLAFAAVLLAVFLRGCAHKLGAYTPLSPLWALSVVGVVLLALLGAFAWLVGPSLVNQGSELTQRLPDALQQIQHGMQQSPWGRYVLRYLSTPQAGPGQSVTLFSRVTHVASTTFSLLTDLILMLFVGIFFAINPALYQRGLLLLIPQRQTARVRAALEAAGQALWHWLMGKLLAMLFVAVCVAVGLLLIGVPMALVLGLIAGLLDFVPYLGAMAGAVPGILLALPLGLSKTLYAGLVYLLALQIEAHLVTPVIQQHTVALPPALLIVAVVACGLLFGLPGIVLTTPLTVLVMVLVQRLYVEDVLGKRVEPVPHSKE